MPKGKPADAFVGGEAPAMRQVYFIEFGTGIDLRGQDVTKAATRAVRNAIGHNSIPAVPLMTGGDPDKLRVTVRLAVPDAVADDLDHEAVRAALPVGRVSIAVQPDGMATSNGAGDRVLIVNAAVEVGI